MEASILSVNMNVYGDLHNMGHVLISLCHDPDGSNLVTWIILPKLSLEPFVSSVNTLLTL